VISRHTLVAALVGAAAGVWAVKTHKLLEDESTILLAIAGAAVALEAVILAAMALIASLLTGFYGKVIEKVGVAHFFRPYKIVAWVSGGAAVAGFAGAMDSETGPKWLQAALFGAAAWLIVWAIVGTMLLVSDFIQNAEWQRELEEDGPETSS
jgi:hypothetical protein